MDHNGSPVWIPMKAFQPYSLSVTMATNQNEQFDKILMRGGGLLHKQFSKRNKLCQTEP